MAPPPRSAAGAPSRSVIVGAAATGHHLVDIEGYSHTKQQLPTGRGVELPPFTAAGHSWRLRYYPNGDAAPFAGFISFSLDAPRDPYLVYLRTAADEVPVRVTLSLLNQAGAPALSQTKTAPLHAFSRPGGLAFRDFVGTAWLEASAHLRDDRLAVRCDVAVPLEVRVEERGPPEPEPAPPPVVVPPSDLHRHLAGLRVDPEGADVTFQAELFGPMKESAGAGDGAAGGVVRVDDMEAEVFGALLGFVYTDAVPEMEQEEEEEAAMAQHLLVAADRYGLERLKLICEEKLCRRIDTASAAAILALAEQHGCGGLKRACLHFLSSPATLSEVVATDGFDHLARSCPSVMKELIHNICSRASNC
ncbi:hypothetical protein ACP4OV_017246 [Aristida adscensionis]